PVLAATSWALPGEIGFYCQGHPTVYNIGRLQGDRHSQYDLWLPNPCSTPQAFLGRTFIIVDMYGPALRPGFDSVEQVRPVTHRENGHALSGWTLTVAHQFKGFPQTKTDRY